MKRVLRNIAMKDSVLAGKGIKKGESPFLKKIQSVRFLAKHFREWAWGRELGP